MFCMRRGQKRELVLFPAVTNGHNPKAVQVTVGCAGVVATNGAATRYLRNLPRPLRPLVG